MTKPMATSVREKWAIYSVFGATAISLIGNQLSQLAIPWFILITTGSAVQTGLTAAAGIVPVVLAGFFGGALVDRMGYKRTTVIADIASGATVAFIPLLYGFDLLPFWLLLMLVFLGALLDTPGMTARQALLPELAEAAGLSLERATSLLQIVERATRMIGAPLAGLLIAWFGAENVLWFDSVSFAVSALIIGVAVPVTLAPKVDAQAPEQDQEKPLGYFGELKEGMRFILRDALIFMLLLTVMITNGLSAARTGVVYPVFAQHVYGFALALGLMFSAEGIGAIVGTLLYGAIGERYSKRKLFIFGFMISNLTIFALIFYPWLPIVLALQAFAGIVGGPINPIMGTILFKRVPNNMRGRIMGVGKAGAVVAMPMGVMLAGVLIEATNLRIALLAVGLCYLVTTTGLLFSRALREMDEEPDAHQSVEETPSRLEPVSE
ncbi:MFS transporter [Chloroflexi bacterium TSY]|nr:MFS transporter [Chloroflexi bacterium TSY]